MQQALDHLIQALAALELEADKAMLTGHTDTMEKAIAIAAQIKKQIEALNGISQ